MITESIQTAGHYFAEHAVAGQILLALATSFGIGVAAWSARLASKPHLSKS